MVGLSVLLLIVFDSSTLRTLYDRSCMCISRSLIIRPRNALRHSVIDVDLWLPTSLYPWTVSLYSSLLLPGSLSNETKRGKSTLLQLQIYCVSLLLTHAYVGDWLGSGQVERDQLRIPNDQAACAFLARSPYL